MTMTYYFTNTPSSTSPSSSSLLRLTNRKNQQMICGKDMNTTIGPHEISRIGRIVWLRYHRRIQYLSIDFTSACCSHTHTKLIFCAEFYLWALVVAFTVCIYVLTNIESRYLRYGAPFNGTSILDSIIN